MSSPYEVALAPKATEQLRALFGRAPTPLARTFFLHSFRQLTLRLATNPQRFGEKSYRTKLPGGMVYRGALGPFSVQYAIYEANRFVLLFDVRAMPRSYIE